jgi:hypothetical protein
VLLPSISFVRVDVLSGNAELDGFAAVPEPAAVSLFLCGALAFWFVRRQRS